MSKRKNEDLTEQNKVHGSLKRKKSQDNQELQHPNSSTTEHAAIEETGFSSGICNNELAIGGSIQPFNTELSGTIGPFVRITDTGELCFLTARYIFGPYQPLETFKGTLVYQNIFCGDKTKKLQRICGHVVAAEYSENMDIALVKISKECIPVKFQFIDVKEEQMIQAGLDRTNFPLCGNTSTAMDARGLTSQETETYRLVKVGMATGFTSGIFYLKEGKVMTDEYFFQIQRETANCSLTEFVTYQNQLRVLSNGDGRFAKESDAGAAVYLVDTNNRFHCIGTICRAMEDGALVTPIQDILQHLSRQLGQTLELVTFDSQMATDSFNPYEKAIFDRALKTGKENDRHIRVNIIGFYGQGKTSLTRRLLQDSLDDIESTDGIDVHIRKCKISKGGWETFGAKNEIHELSRRLVAVAHSENVKGTKGNENTEKWEDSLDLTSPLSECKSASLTSLDSDTKNGESSKRTREPENAGGDINIENCNIYTKNRTLLRHFSENLRHNKALQDDELLATIWDFGGQFIYYTTHQIFHSRDAIYLLVFDLNKDLDNVIEDTDFPERQEKMKNSLMFWVNSINAFVGTDDSMEPVIILVGTHKDTFEGDVDAKLEEVKNLFAGTDVRKHIYEQTFAVAIFDTHDNVINDLRSIIHQIGIKKAANKQIPANWIPLEMLLLEERETRIVTFERVKCINAHSDSPIEDVNELKLFLKYHHDKGTLVYFDEEELNEYVILNPQFLVDAFRCIITSKSVCDGSARLYQLWKRMINMAILEQELLNAVLSKNKQFSKFSAIVLKFLKRHRILAEILKMEEIKTPKSVTITRTGNYMIPSFLKACCNSETAEKFIHGKTFSSVILGISLENNIVLSTLYERVTAAAVGIWPPIVFRDQYLVFQNAGYFLLDFQHTGKITKVEGKGLELMVIKLVPSKEDLAVISDGFRRYVEMVVRQEFRKLHDDPRNDPFSHYIKCNHTEHNGKGSTLSHVFEEIKGKKKVCCPDYENHSIQVRQADDEWFQKETLSENKQKLADRKVTERDLVKIAQAIGSNWKLLAFELDIPADEVDRIEMKNHHAGISTTLFYILKYWMDHNSENAYLSSLIASIQSIGELTVNNDKLRNVIDDF
ncbi:uncharacterized protein LOC123540198 [Mercenaria mercenaria]|uniref:uncharacterized protein LOC123540198 n=1 Tax=Mercenaria mercenaria TaxID=6596 RepID=UPI00234F5017|nr:uncharacterized protein LOC123540198 [Mercenaria mercenaria]